jgi:hypothetical protein
MFWKRPKKVQWAMKSLLQRLSTLEDGVALNADHAPTEHVHARQTHPIAFFFVGLVCAGLVGVAALTIISIVTGSSPNGSPTYALTSAAGAALMRPPNQERRLWWRLPPRATAPKSLVPIQKNQDKARPTSSKQKP